MLANLSLSNQFEWSVTAKKSTFALFSAYWYASSTVPVPSDILVWECNCPKYKFFLTSPTVNFHSWVVEFSKESLTSSTTVWAPSAKSSSTEYFTVWLSLVMLPLTSFPSSDNLIEFISIPDSSWKVALISGRLKFPIFCPLDGFKSLTIGPVLSVALFTFTIHCAFISGFIVDLTSIVVCPSFIATTFPSLSTVTISGFKLIYSTLFSVVFSGI